VEKEKILQDTFKLNNEEILSESDIVKLHTKYFKKIKKIEDIKALRKKK
jgi:hypothetical protein